MQTAVAMHPAAPPSNVIATDAAALMEVITRAGKDPATDVDKLERLMGLYERINDKRAEQLFNDAMTAAQAQMPQVLRNKENDQTNSRYADLAALDKAIRPIYTKNSFALSFGTADGAPAGHYRVTCHVSHGGGFSRDYHADVPIDNVGPKGTQNKTNTHGFGSSMSYGRRYLTLLIFNISTTDDDGNAAGSEQVSDEQVMELANLISEKKANMVKFLAYMKVSALYEIPAAQFNKAKVALQAQKAKQ